MALVLLIFAIRGGIAAHRDFNCATPPEPRLNRRGRPVRRGPATKGGYWLVTKIEQKKKGRLAAWKLAAPAGVELLEEDYDEKVSCLTAARPFCTG